MYTKKFRPVEDDEDAVEDWEILDPDGEFVVAIASEHDADVLLSHLNR